MKAFIILISLCFISTFTWGQTLVKGHIKDEKGEPIQGATVIAYPVGQNSILGFGISKEDGAYTVKLKSTPDSIQITVRSLGFETQGKVIPTQNATADFTLLTTDKYLKELKVKADPITEEGDTINYNTDSFAREGDESLEDVLKRLPGVEVDKSGKISYEGRTINKFYIEGKDLLGGQYSIASKNLPKDAVASVEVIKDHQPIKMLEDVVHSIDPAINIVLKEGVTLTGNAELGGGVPAIWYGKVTPMLFNKKHQSVNVISSTNSGKDELSMFNEVSLFDFLEFGGVIESKPMYLLGDPPIESNLFDKSEYNDHQTHVMTTNYITGLGKGDLKVNIDVYDDLRFQETLTDFQYFTPIDTVQIQNAQQSDYREKYLKTRFTYEHNVKAGFTKNVFHFKVKDNQTLSDFYQNNEYIPQQVQQTFFSVGNKLSKVVKIKDSFHQLNAFLEYSRTPERLNFTGGPLINLQDENDRVVQNTLQDQLKGYLGTSFIKKWNNYTLNTQLSFNYQYKTLFSYPQDDAIENNPGAKNKLTYTSLVPKISPNFSYRKKGVFFSFTPHVSFQSRTLNDLQLESEDQVNQFVVEPFAFVQYKYKSFTFNNSYTFQNNFSELPQMYSGVIVKDFRTANQLPLPILSTQSHAISSTLAYDNPSSALNAKAQYKFNRDARDWINRYDINEDGVVLVRTSTFNNNKSTSHWVSGSLHWFILDLTTNVRGKVTMNSSSENVIVNETVNQNTTTSLAWEGIVDFPIVKGLIINTYYKGYYTENSFEALEQADWSQHIWGVDIEFNKKKHLLKWHNKWIEHTFIEDEFLYLDFSYQYKFNEKTFIRFTAQNLLNNRNYTQANFDTYFSQQTYYLLRPRQLMATIRFKL